MRRRIIDDYVLDTIKRLVAGGYSNEEIAKALNVSAVTFERWLRKDPRVREAVEQGQVLAIDEFLKSAINKLTGYRVVEQHTVEVYKPDKEGNLRLVRVEKHTDEKYIPPDTTFMIFWAKNRLKDKFSDEQKLTVSATTRFIEVEKVYVKHPDDGEQK